MLDTRQRDRLSEAVLLAFVVFSVLWKGGKSLESTWLLGGLAVLLTVLATRFFRVGALPWKSWTIYLVLSVAAFALSLTRNYGLDEILRDASVFLIFVWVVRQPHKERFVNRFAACLTAAALIAVLLGIAVYTLQPVSRFVGSFFDWRFHTDYWPNAWADLVLLSWPAAVFLLRRRSALLGLALALLWGSMLLSFSRGGFLALVAQVLLLLICGAIVTIRKSVRMDKPLIRAVLTASVIGCLGAGLMFVSVNTLRSYTFPIESVSDKAAFTAAEGTSSVSERRSFWDAAIAMTSDRPVFGWGPYSFRFVQPAYQTSVLATADHPHNVFLKIAAERGLPALLVFIVLLCSILVPAKLQLLRIRKTVHGPSVPWIIASMTAIIGLLLHSLIDYNLQFVGVLVPFWIFLGTITVPHETASKWQISIERVIAVVLTIVLLIEGGFLVTSSLGRRAEAGERVADAVQWYERSRRQLFGRDLLLGLAGLRAGTGAEEDALRDLEAYERQNSRDARLWLLRGNIEEKLGRYPEAKAAYERVWEYGKYNILNSLSGLLRVAEATNDRALLDARKEEFLTVFRAYADAILANTHFIALSGSVEELQHVSNYLIRAYPDAGPEIRERTAKAARHASEERSHLTERKHGLLW